MSRVPEHALTFIVGGDMADSLPTWQEPEAVLDWRDWPSPSATDCAARTSRARLEPLHRRRPRGVLRHATHRPVLVGDPRSGRRRAPDPVPRPRPGGRGDPSPAPVPKRRWEACRMTLSPERLATTAAALAADKKASDIVVLDLREVAGYTDFFVIVSGTSDRQAKAIHDGIHLGLKKQRDCFRGGSRASARRVGSSWTTSTSSSTSSRPRPATSIGSSRSGATCPAATSTPSSCSPSCPRPPASRADARRCRERRRPPVRVASVEWS